MGQTQTGLLLIMDGISVLTGLSRFSGVDTHGMVLGLGKMPLFRHTNKIGCSQRVWRETELAIILMARETHKHNRVLASGPHGCVCLPKVALNGAVINLPAIHLILPQKRTPPLRSTPHIPIHTNLPLIFTER